MVESGKGIYIYQSTFTYIVRSQTAETYQINTKRAKSHEIQITYLIHLESGSPSSRYSPINNNVNDHLLSISSTSCWRVAKKCISHQVKETCCELIHQGVCLQSRSFFVFMFVTREKIVYVAADECGNDIKFITDLERLANRGSSPHTSRETSCQNVSGSSDVCSSFRACTSPAFTVSSRHSSLRSSCAFCSTVLGNFTARGLRD